MYVLYSTISVRLGLRGEGLEGFSQQLTLIWRLGIVNLEGNGIASA